MNPKKEVLEARKDLQDDISIMLGRFEKIHNVTIKDVTFCGYGLVAGLEKMLCTPTVSISLEEEEEEYKDTEEADNNKR